ncbi:WG repeat-containing protein [Clostridium tagluense]|uniref:WG repeat-containing protein n=1 Tax=Clostridium tagluense TaxID=360422 RepID=UPI001C0D0AC1|nr:WG repeat-containing protein [Clostridium tagluense]MBU3130577.1 WG repeat-containing protein [Clostridium tagluense]
MKLKKIATVFICLLVFGVFNSNVYAATKKIPIQIKSIGNLSLTITQTDSFMLPAALNAKMSNGSVKSVSVTWDKKVDYSKIGIQSFKGTVNGYKNKVLLTLNIKDEANLDKIKKMSLYNFQLKDGIGGLYDVYIYQINSKKEIASIGNCTTWAGASEGDIIYKGIIKIAYCKSDSSEVKVVNKLSEWGETYVSANLVKKIENKYEGEPDLLLLGQRGSCRESSAYMFYIHNDRMKQISFIYSENERSEYSIISNTNDVFFRQTGVNTFESNNFNEGIYYVITFEFNSGTGEFKKISEQKMTGEEFELYKNENKIITKDTTEVKYAIEPKLNYANDFIGGLALVEVDGKYGFIDKTGKIVIEPQFNAVNNFSEDLAYVVVDGKYGFINKTGKIVIKPQFDDVTSFSEGLAMVNVGNLWGFIDKTGKIICEPQFNAVGNFNDGLVGVRNDNNKWGVIDKTGKIVCEPQFDEINNFSEGLATVKIDDKWGVIDKTGKIICEPQFDEINNFSEGLATVEIDDKWGVIDKTGEFVINPQFEDLNYFSEGLAAFKLDGKCGIINKTGKIICEPQFDEVVYFSEGLVEFKSGDLWGIIDKAGKIVCEPQFDYVSQFREGLAMLKVDGKYGYIDITGKIVIKPQFDEVYYFSEGLSRVKIGGKYGFIITPLTK